LDEEEIYSKILSAKICPELEKLLIIYLVLPVSTVECESSFSAVTRIKTKFRSLL